jgi:hypothetical protein
MRPQTLRLTLHVVGWAKQGERLYFSLQTEVYLFPPCRVNAGQGASITNPTVLAPTGVSFPPSSILLQPIPHFSERA